jgi:hypothetical protein
MLALPALALSQQLALLSVLSVFFIIFSGLLQRIQMTLDLGYLLLASLDGFPVFSNFISPLNRFCFPVVTTANEF